MTTDERILAALSPTNMKSIARLAATSGDGPGEIINRIVESYFRQRQHELPPTPREEEQIEANAKLFSDVRAAREKIAKY